jgi:aminopeptidase N
MTVRRIAALAATALLVSLAAGCGSGSASEPPAPQVAGSAGDTHTTAYDAARSTPHEDSFYPSVGDPGVDALHYSLDLTWQPKTSLLTGHETLLFRAARTGDTFQLDLSHQLTVQHLWVDGSAASFQHAAKDLVVEHPVTKGSRYVLQLTYSGNPQPVPAPTDRPDFDTTGWTTTSDGSVWTMQEPYGAYSWYAVNDQPSDKAFYDFTIDAPSSMVGVANGSLRSRHTAHGRTITRWHLPEPAASYLVTIAIGHYTETKDTGPHGLPITYWTPTNRAGVLAKVRYAPQAIAFLEKHVGRYPYPTLGVLVVPSDSAMETQSMITLGDTRYTLSKDTLVHELSHQWYGDEVTPNDWSDLWMNEGMAAYLAEATWSGTHTGSTRTQILRRWSMFVPQMRAQYGPPANYRHGSFGEGNVYYIPALMWDTLRQRLGDKTFWSLAAQWPRSHRFTSQNREVLAAWWSTHSGLDLTTFFHRWLLGSHEPRWHAG